MPKNQKTSVGFSMPNWKNRTLFHGDNLDFLRAMNSDSVHLIATDPPFNKGRDFHATPDSLADGASFHDRWTWKDDVEQEWVDQITDDWPLVMNVIQGSRNSYGDDMGAFLCYMAVRLLEMRRVLREDGSIYLHCDTTASHYLKELMDAIFGWKQFRNEIVWRRTGSHGNSKRWGPIHDTIFFYTRSDQYTWNWPKQPYMRGHVDEHFVKDGDEYRTNYYGNVLTGSGLRGGLSGQPWRGIDPSAKNRHWAIPRKLWEESGLDDTSLTQHDKLDALYEAGLIRIEKGSTWPIYERRIRSDDGPATSDIWAYQPYTEGTVFGTEDGIDADASWIKPGAKERTGFETQKPIALYARIINASSNEGEIVLDPFAGCATTCVASERLNRQWVGIDIWEKAHDVVITRLEKEGLLGNFKLGDINYTSELPERTDAGETVAPFMKAKKRVDEPKGQKMSRAQMVKYLLEQHGQKCQGCGREFDDPRYLELDHNTPRSDGGINHISNRILLCGPCNKVKSNTLTLSGLRRENKKNDWMADQQTKLQL